ARTARAAAALAREALEVRSERSEGAGAMGRLSSRVRSRDPALLHGARALVRRAGREALVPQPARRDGDQGISRSDGPAISRGRLRSCLHRDRLTRSYVRLAPRRARRYARADEPA